MRLAVLSDVHSNLEALEAVLASADADEIVVLGDIIGYGADPDAVVRALDAAGATLIAGNHDMALTGRFDLAWFNAVAAEAVRWTDRTMDPDLVARIASLEPMRRDDGRLLVHGSVRDPAGEYLRDQDGARASFEAEPFVTGFYGHTHIPAAYRALPDDAERIATTRPLALQRGERYLLNPGSVGQPRDGDPRACYLTVEDDIVRWHRVAYDVAGAQRKIRDAGLPGVLADRLAVGR